MNILTALSLNTLFASTVFCSAASADDMTQQLQLALQQPLTELRENTAQQARQAMQQTVIDLLAHQAAEQDATDVLLALRGSDLTDRVAE